jgi:hypothetical protein
MWNSMVGNPYWTTVRTLEPIWLLMAFMVFVRESTEMAEEEGILNSEQAALAGSKVADKADKGSEAPDCGELNRNKRMKAEKAAVYLGAGAWPARKQDVGVWGGNDEQCKLGRGETG